VDEDGQPGDGDDAGGSVVVAIAQLPDADELDAICDAIDHRRHATLTLSVDVEGGRDRYDVALPPCARLYVAGAGPIGRVLARLASDVGFNVEVFDDRPELLRLLENQGIRTVTGDVAASLQAAPIDDQTYCTILPRGREADEATLEAVVGRSAAYVGLIEVRERVERILDALRSRGVPEADLAAVCTPRGLEPGGQTAPEIALTIAAELVEARRSNVPPAVTGPVSVDSND
jgi:xanthine dehydrogenase accessory factor